LAASAFGVCIVLAAAAIAFVGPSAWCVVLTTTCMALVQRNVAHMVASAASCCYGVSFGCVCFYTRVVCCVWLRLRLRLCGCIVLLLCISSAASAFVLAFVLTAAAVRLIRGCVCRVVASSCCCCYCFIGTVVIGCCCC
jgi:hypothetical protein